MVMLSRGRDLAMRSSSIIWAVSKGESVTIQFWIITLLVTSQWRGEKLASFRENPVSD
jgi:hypothetical protein